jgi:hypothetical protein
MADEPAAISPQEKLKQDVAWYLTLLLVIMVACLPGFLCSLYYLSTVPDVTWQRGDLTYDRVWMARERAPVGIAYETQRIHENISAEEICVVNTIRYFLWNEVEGGDQNSRYSQLMVKTDNGWQSNGQSCEE